MIDIHCHILPGVDDGAKDIEETRAMLRTARKQRVRWLIATPHYETGMEKLEKICQVRALKEARGAAAEIDPGMRIYSGNEILYDSGSIDALKNGYARTLAGSPYVLIEFYPWTEYLTICRAVQRLQEEGYWPVLAHVERYRALERMEHVQDLVKLGTVVQTNADVLAGKNGRALRRRIRDLIGEELVHLVGSDAHGDAHRRYHLREANRYLERKLGREVRERLTKENPYKIIKGERIIG